MKNLLMLFPLLLAACTTHVTEEHTPSNYEFTREFITTMCDRYISCTGDASMTTGSCVDKVFDSYDAKGIVVTDEPLDCGASGAKACIRAVQSASCDVVANGEQDDPSLDPCRKCKPY